MKKRMSLGSLEKFLVSKLQKHEMKRIGKIHDMTPSDYNLHTMLNKEK